MVSDVRCLLLVDCCSMVVVSGLVTGVCCSSTAVSCLPCVVVCCFVFVIRVLFSMCCLFCVDC